MEHLKQDRRVQEVAYNAAVVENIDANVGKLDARSCSGFTALLLIIAIALINNTIRLAIYSKRFLIRTMHLVGATQWFIKKPFLGQSLWQGIVGAVLAIGLLVGLLQLAQALHARPACLHRHAPRLAMLFGGVLVLGLLISLVSTWFAVRPLPSHEFRGPTLELTFDAMAKHGPLINDMAFTGHQLQAAARSAWPSWYVGFILMSGGGNGDPNAFDESAIFSRAPHHRGADRGAGRLPLRGLRHPEEVRRRRDGGNDACCRRSSSPSSRASPNSCPSPAPGT